MCFLELPKYAWNVTFKHRIVTFTPAPSSTANLDANESLASVQLKPFYMDYASELPSSPNRSAVQGLNLLFLLVENRLAEFHSELELMGDGERSEPCVVFPVRLEQYLMVGSYDQVSWYRVIVCVWGGRVE